MKTVLFDLDGTLANTEVLKAQGLSLAVRQFGGFVAPGVYKNVMGQSWEAVTGKFFERANIQVPSKEFDPVFREIYTSLIDSLEPNLETEKLIHSLKSKNYQLGLVSSAAPWMIEKILSRLNFKNVFDSIVGGDDVKNHKPDPEAYLVVLQKLNADIKFTIAFEDSESGFKAANAANLKVYGIRHEYNEGHDFSLCAQVFDSLSQAEILFKS
jgi:HAD superfamily hydrolase (TIGR01509 family)